MSDRFVTRGFVGRRGAEGSGDADPRRDPARPVPDDDFPVLSAGPTPHTPLDEWTFSIDGLVDEPRALDLGRVPRAPDRGVDGRHPLRHQVVQARHALGGRLASTRCSRTSSTTADATSSPSCDGGYTTNLPLEDVTDGQAWVAFDYDGEPLDPEHGGPARLLVPHLLLLEEREVGARAQLRDEDEPGFWETLGYHNHGDPWREQRYWGD